MPAKASWQRLIHGATGKPWGPKAQKRVYGRYRARPERHRQRELRIPLGCRASDRSPAPAKDLNARFGGQSPRLFRLLLWHKRPRKALRLTHRALRRLRLI